MAASQVCVRKMSSWKGKCYWKTKDWNLLVFWSLPPSVHRPQYSLGQPQLEVFHIHQVFCIAVESATLPLSSYWTGIATTATIRNWSIECYRMFYSFWDPPSVTGIFYSWLQRTDTYPATSTAPKCSSSRGTRDSGRGNWATEEFHSLFMGKIVCF